MNSAGSAKLGQRFELAAHAIESWRPRRRGPSPLHGTIAKASGKGVCATSAPRMLKARRVWDEDDQRIGAQACDSGRIL